MQGAQQIYSKAFLVSSRSETSPIASAFALPANLDLPFPSLFFLLSLAGNYFQIPDEATKRKTARKREREERAEKKEMSK